MIKSERGQSLVEMALALPVLLIILMGIFDVGRIMYTYMHLELATQETVRLGGLGRDDAAITEFARDYVHIGDPDLLEVSITPGDTTRKSGDYIRVSLQYPVEYVTPFISNILPSPVLLKTDSTIRVE
ncbi:TadE/TadG family type IV pilus assembly protein [Pseudalkalibacillus berkeleyi]|uniref:Pilus assembly protein n=1 Tax=Pseudalkalibacillus berkeleyi TaxID=1069813 RepID=A0ABS9H5X8_9BACL|nr:TadE/TadG family type IV pilus assembly protein [Pseudalkalibacillus berkeleyi]MCF6139278.1 pilus assembly protein [Pseudalkalibacillus berkeleyi]